MADRCEIESALIPFPTTDQPPGVLLVTRGFNLLLPLGVIGHEGSTVLVCLNGLRPLTFRTWPGYEQTPAAASIASSSSGAAA